MSVTKMPKMVPIPFEGDESHRRWMLLEDWVFRWGNKLIVIEKGFVFNGASIPKIFSNIFASTGILFLAALIHDHLYQHRWIWIIEPQKGDLFYEKNKQKLYCSKEVSDDIFGQIALISYPEFPKAIWIAKKSLTLGGQSAWDKCRKAEGNYIPPPDPEKNDRYWE